MSKVTLVGLTKPSAYTGCNTAEELVAYCARVSNPANQANHQTGAKLVRHLLEEGHWSPLEMVNVNIEVETTRDIARQILRHRSFSFQEFSQRYAKATKFETREARLQDKKNRQNSIQTDDSALKEEWMMRQAKLLQSVEEDYNWALNMGIAKEQARAILPEGLTSSTLYMNGTLRSWVHFCMLRMGNGTQLEHMEVAKQCWEVLKQHFPNVIQACEETHDGES
jgi:thymidylate synthase (FAD)